MVFNNRRTQRETDYGLPQYRNMRINGLDPILIFLGYFYEKKSKKIDILIKKIYICVHMRAWCKGSHKELKIL